MSVLLLFRSTAAPSQNVGPAGNIASQEAFGTPTVHQQLRPLGIESSEVFGTPVVSQQLRPLGIEAQEAFGTPTVEQQLVLGGIPSQEAFGDVTVTQDPAPGYNVMALRPRRIGRMRWVETFRVS